MPVDHTSLARIAASLACASASEARRGRGVNGVFGSKGGQDAGEVGVPVARLCDAVAAVHAGYLDPAAGRRRGGDGRRR